MKIYYLIERIKLDKMLLCRYFVTFFSHHEAHFMWLKSVSLCFHGLLTDHNTYSEYFKQLSSRPKFPPLLVLIYTFVNSQKIGQSYILREHEQPDFTCSQCYVTHAVHRLYTTTLNSIRPF